MRRIFFAFVAVVALAGVAAHMVPASGQSDEEAAPIYGIKIPPGYRDWGLISVAHEEGNLNDLRAILGNGVAINAYREGKLPFPDGTIIAGSPGVMSPRRKTTKSLAAPNRSWPGLPRTGFSLWSRTQENTHRRAAGGLLNLTAANPPARRCTALGFPAMSPSKLATLSSPITHLEDRHTRRHKLWRDREFQRGHLGGNSSATVKHGCRAGSTRKISLLFCCVRIGRPQLLRARPRALFHEGGPYRPLE